MKEKNYDYELKIAKDAAIEAWQKIAHFYDVPIAVEIKADGSPVTLADKTASHLIIASLQKAFPLDSIISEEDAPIIKGQRTWYIDPIDGTKGFIKRNAKFGVHIGLCEQDRPVAGIVYWAVAGEMYSGATGRGAWRENARGILELKTARSSSNELIASVKGDTVPKDLAKLYGRLGIKEFVDCGGGGVGMMKIAENRANIRISDNHSGASTWDTCAPQAIIEAAGGVMQYLDGSPLLYHRQGKLGKRYMIATNADLANKTVEIFNREKYPIKI